MLIGILNTAYPEIKTNATDIVQWFKDLNNYLDYLHIPEDLIDCCVKSILTHISAELKPYFLEAQKNLNIYHANIFTIKTEIFVQMMETFEHVFSDVIKYYE